MLFLLQLATLLRHADTLTLMLATPYMIARHAAALSMLLLRRYMLLLMPCLQMLMPLRAMLYYATPAFLTCSRCRHADAADFTLRHADIRADAIAYCYTQHYIAIDALIAIAVITSLLLPITLTPRLRADASFAAIRRAATLSMLR